MFSLTQTFRNSASTPIRVAIQAHADESGIIRNIFSIGGTFNGFTEDAKAEVQRMRNWIERTFVGCPAKDFANHDGVVPDGAGVAELDYADLERRIFASGTVDPFNLDQRERRYAPITPEQAEEFIYRNLARALGLDYEELRRDLREGVNRPEPEVGHEGFTAAPNVGTYWQDRERPVRFFFLISKHECEGHTHMRMLRVDHARGGEYEFVYENDAQWGRSFKRVAQVDVPGNTVAGRTVVLMDRGTCKVSFDGGDAFPASEMTDDQLNTVVAEHGEAHPGLRDFLEEQRPQLRIEFPARVPLSSLKSKALPFTLLGDEPDAYAKLAADYGSVQYRSALDGVPRYMQQFLDALDFTGTESPPAVGERYFSWISGATYRVVDVRRKLHQTDYYVTMEREPDGRRAKYTYRDHAAWLAMWRPADDEGNARPVEMVDVPTTAIDLTVVDDAGSAMAKLGTAAHEAEHQLRAIYRELDRKVPGWREAGDGDHVFLDDVALALRAIRTLSKHMNNYRQLAEQLRRELASAQEHAGEQLKAINTANKRHSAQMRENTDRMREMVMVFAKGFKEQFGGHALKEQIIAMNATSIANLPFEQIVPFMERCCTYARRHGG